MSGRSGFASLVVLWAMLLLGTLALAFSTAMRTEAMAARNGYDASRAYYQARSGVGRALAMLSSMPPDNVAAAEIGEREGDAGYEVAVVPENGKVDVNSVAEAALKQILEKGGLTAEAADALGDAILDWRDADGDRRLHGAEEDDYARDPEPVRPRNGRIADLRELLSVRGMTRPFFAAFASRVFTAQGTGAAVDINAAPPELLRAMPGVSESLAEAILARRRESRFGGAAEAARFLAEAGLSAADAARFTAGAPSRAFTVRSTGTAGGRARRTVSCLVEIGGIGENPVRMVRWDDRADEDGG
jgi:general secretion pathway protein K